MTDTPHTNVLPDSLNNENKKNNNNRNEGGRGKEGGECLCTTLDKDQDPREDSVSSIPDALTQPYYPLPRGIDP